MKQQEPSAEADGSYQMADPNSAGNEYGKLELLIWNWSYNAKCYCINKKHERYHTNN